MLAIVLLTGACGPTGVLDVRRPLRVRLSVDRQQALVNEVFTFNLDVTGTRLFEVHIAFGDGNRRVFTIPGAATLAARPTHAYTAPGTYRIEASAQIEAGEIVSESLLVVVR